MSLVAVVSLSAAGATTLNVTCDIVVAGGKWRHPLSPFFVVFNFFFFHFKSETLMGCTDPISVSLEVGSKLPLPAFVLKCDIPMARHHV